MPVQLPFEPTAPRGAGTSRALGAFLLAGLLGLAVLGAGCVKHAAVKPPVAPETLVDTTGAPLAPAVFAAELVAADYLLLGEEHPNPCDHQAQAAVIRRLAAAGVLPAIGLEMVPADYQGVLDAFNSGTLPLAELPAKLDWKTTWGFDFELYAPIFQAAREYKLPVYALNAPKGLARKVGRQGLDALTPAERASLPGAILPPAQAQVEELRELFAHHGAMRKAAPQENAKPESLPKAATAAKDAAPARDPFENFVTVQSLWDTQMAARALYARAVSGRPVAVVAGAGHVANGWGIARRLAVLDPSAKVALVVPWRGGEAPDAEAAPYFFACPAAQKSRLGMTLTQDQPTPGQPAALPLVTAVTSGSPAAKAGLLPGDAVVAAGGHPANNLSVLHKAAIEAVKDGKTLSLTVSRAGETLVIDIPIALPAAK